jgi:Leucine-rich repeat (LRR) protein
MLLNNLEEIDFSHNLFNGIFELSGLPRIKKLNLSHTDCSKYIVKNSPQLTHLDISSNDLLTTLDLQGSQSLVELNCSSSPLLVNFSLPSLTNLKSFDCLGVKFTKSDNIVSPTSMALATATVYTDNPALFSNIIGLGIYSGISTLG